MFSYLDFRCYFEANGPSVKRISTFEKQATGGGLWQFVYTLSCCQGTAFAQTDREIYGESKITPRLATVVRVTKIRDRV